MKQREIKFRAWDVNAKIMRDDGESPNGKPHMKYDVGVLPHHIKSGWVTGIDGLNIQPSSKDFVLMQFTGKLGFNNCELYEGDIVFYEEAEDGGDKRYYMVIIWIPEWSMFASLHLDEYRKFIEQGAETLDEIMFWTYNLQDSEHYHFAGTIYSTPDLLNT